MMLPFLVVVSPPQEPRVFDVARAFLLALHDARIDRKQAQIEMGLDKSQLSRQLNEFGLNLAKLALLPKAFWREYLPKLATVVDCEDLLQPVAAHTDELAAVRAEVADLRAIVNGLLAQERRRA